MEKKVIREKIAIIGMGPAGISAAIYLTRYNFKPICFEKNQIGGKVGETHKVENYPGFIGEIDDLIHTFEEQIKYYNIDVRSETVETVSLNEDGTFNVTTDGSFYIFDAVLLATGLKERPYVVPNSQTYFRRGISTCATCDGPFFRNQEVSVLGGGNTAFEEALYLATICKKVNLINRRNEFKADETLVEEFRNLPNTELITPYVIVDSKGDNKIRSLTLENQETHETKEINAEALFIYIGSAPVSDFIKIEDLQIERGFIKANEVMETNIPGFFVAGDCRETPLRQIATAVSDGALASISIKKYVNGLKK